MNSFPRPIVKQDDDIHKRSLTSWFRKGDICLESNKEKNNVLHSCKRSLKITIFASQLPSLDRWEGHNRRLLQVTEILGALGHDLEVTIFHSWNTSLTHSIESFLHNVGVKLNPVNMPQARNGKIPKGAKNIPSQYITNIKPDIVLLFFSFYDVYYFDFILNELRRVLPATKVITALDEPNLSPIEWLPLYYRISGGRHKSENTTAKQFQQQVFDLLDKRYIELSDTVLLNSIGKFRLLTQTSDDKSHHKMKLLRTMLTPTEVHNNRKIATLAPPPRGSRKNIVFIGTGNLQMNYQALKWFDTNIMQDLNNGIPGIICDVYGKNWYRVKHDLENKSMFRFLGAISSEEMAILLDNYVAFVFPFENTLMGVNSYPLLAFERGLPVVFTQLGAQGLCDECLDLSIKNPLITTFEEEAERNFPFLVATGLTNYNFVEKVKLLRYDEIAWRNYSSKALAHSKAPWFSRYQAALDIDSIVEALMK